MTEATSMTWTAFAILAMFSLKGSHLKHMYASSAIFYVYSKYGGRGEGVSES